MTEDFFGLILPCIQDLIPTKIVGLYATNSEAYSSYLRHLINHVGAVS